ncbi:late control gene D protein (GPD) [Aneurinibacillus soli]|uniref:Uncharacterized protein n=1 Tax=Aneurinibacillus soli TaxID=1500254 RepID=A0A0U5B1L3_9BACL|nr:contractile injection system protein, VgrG/Pvc8 family [Aneurinibacillus soli]PYE62637.1 late control gene D protein (GPD) [Aneurinibacillus soli]BAU27199.1 hypothetical protein CB4_01368 [Aneurinibacillus soli]
MSLSVISYNNLEIKPFQLVNLQKLKIIKKMNDHARLFFTGIVSEELKDSYVEVTEAQTNVQVNCIDKENKRIPLFAGVIINVEIKAVRDIYYIEVEAMSHTYLLDIKRKNRSFQNENMPYSALLKEIVSDYSNVDVVDEITEGANLGTFTIQYQETDWEFLRRLASRFYTGLVPAANFSSPKISFGMPQKGSKGEIDAFHYSARKKMSDFRYSTENYLQNMDENDFIYYEVETDQVFDIGNQVTFKEKTYVVSEVVTQMEKGLLKHQYTLCRKQGTHQNTLYNSRITGVSILGRVIDVQRDKLKVHLEIDKAQSKSEAHWFSYSSVYTAEGHSGWYCMPELNDFVNIYFPSTKEEEAIAINSIRKDSEVRGHNKLGDPDVKYFRTAFGKELMFSPTEIVITGKDGEVFIRLNEKDGIQIFSQKDIKIIAKENISLDSEKKIILSAKESITLTCKESKINMDGSTSIFGKEVKTN